MSRLNIPENFSGRVNYAAKCLVKGPGMNGFTRSFDNCFENCDGEVVVAALARRAQTNMKLLAGLRKWFDESHVSDCVNKYAGVSCLADAARRRRKLFAEGHTETLALATTEGK